MKVSSVLYQDRDLIGINLEKANMLSELLAGLPICIRDGVVKNLEAFDTNAEKTKHTVITINLINYLRSKVDFTMMDASQADISIAAYELTKNFHITLASNPSMSVRNIFKRFYKNIPVIKLTKNDIEKINSGLICLGELEKFWIGKINKATIQNRELLASKLGLIGGKNFEFVTDLAVNELKRSVLKQEKFRQNNVVSNTKTGEYFHLSDCKSPQDQRYAEAVCMLNGLNKYSKSQDYAAVFITITVPGKMHISKRKNCVTPTDIQKYLLQRWNKYSNQTSQWVTPAHYFRVIEPHEDGTPHWHVMAFFPKEKLLDHQTCLLEAFKLKNSESNLIDWKVLKKSVDKSRVVGYMLKKVHRDFKSSKDIKNKNISARNHAYMKVWGLRSHLFIGFPQNTITFWRELRSNNYSQLPNELREVQKQVLKNNFPDYFDFFLKNKGKVGIYKIDTETKKSKKISGVIWKNKKYLSSKPDYKIVSEGEAISIQDEITTELTLKKPSTTFIDKVLGGIKNIAGIILRPILFLKQKVIFKNNNLGSFSNKNATVEQYSMGGVL